MGEADACGRDPAGVGSGQWARGPRGRRAPGTEPALRLLPLQRGTYLPQTYIIQEEMVVTEHVSDKEALGSFIYHLCSGKDTYRLRRRATRRREWPAPPVWAPALSSKPSSGRAGPRGWRAALPELRR